MQGFLHTLEGGNVLGVEERVGVDARLEGEQGEGEEGGEGGPGHAPGEEGAAQRAGEEEEVSGDVAEQVDVAHVVDARGLLGEQERQIERHAVILLVGIGEAEFVFTEDVAPIDFGEQALRTLVEGHPVIVEYGGAGHGEENASGEEDETRAAPHARGAAGV